MKTEKKEILKELLLSQNRGVVLNLKLKGIAKPVKTAVQHVGHNSIILHPVCINGQPVVKNIITMLDIEWVRRYDVTYGSKVLESIRALHREVCSL